jgi:hypothetical protein
MISNMAGSDHGFDEFSPRTNGVAPVRQRKRIFFDGAFQYRPREAVPVLRIEASGRAY